MVFLYHPNVGAVRQEQFDGDAGDLTEFGIVRYNEANPGTGRIYKLGGRDIAVDTVIVKPAVWASNGDVVEEPGSTWRIYEGGLGGLRNAFRLVTATREQATAGAPMKTPTGHVIKIDGNPVPQPASGQPARDPWTGQLIPGELQP